MKNEFELAGLAFAEGLSVTHARGELKKVVRKIFISTPLEKELISSRNRHRLTVAFRPCPLRAGWRKAWSYALTSNMKMK